MNRWVGVGFCRSSSFTQGLPPHQDLLQPPHSTPGGGAASLADPAIHSHQSRLPTIQPPSTAPPQYLAAQPPPHGIWPRSPLTVSGRAAPPRYLAAQAPHPREARLTMRFRPRPLTTTPSPRSDSDYPSDSIPPPTPTPTYPHFPFAPHSLAASPCAPTPLLHSISAPPPSPPNPLYFRLFVRQPLPRPVSRVAGPRLPPPAVSVRRLRRAIGA